MKDSYIKLNTHATRFWFFTCFAFFLGKLLTQHTSLKQKLKHNTASQVALETNFQILTENSRVKKVEVVIPS